MLNFAYELKTQDRFNFWRTITGATTSYYFPESTIKRLYITDINAQWNIGTYNALNGLNFNSTDATHASSTALKLQVGFYNTIGSINIHFDVPFLLDYTKSAPDNILKIAVVNGSSAGNDRIWIQIVGFWEI